MNIRLIKEILIGFTLGTICTYILEIISELTDSRGIIEYITGRKPTNKERIIFSIISGIITGFVLYKCNFKCYT